MDDLAGRPLAWCRMRVELLIGGPGHRLGHDSIPVLVLLDQLVALFSLHVSLTWGPAPHPASSPAGPRHPAPLLAGARCAPFGGSEHRILVAYCITVNTSLQ